MNADMTTLEHGNASTATATEPESGRGITLATEEKPREMVVCCRCMKEYPIDRESPSMKLGYAYRNFIFGRVFRALHQLNEDDHLCTSCHGKMVLG